jgi:hypothetical protein
MSNHKIVGGDLPSRPGPPLPPPVAPKLPEITEIQRLRYSPGDRLIVRTTLDVLTAPQSAEIQRRIRAYLEVPDDVPVVVLPAGWDLTVAEPLARRNDAARGE